MAMCVKALVAHDRRVSNEYQYRLSRIGRFVNSSYDEEMTTVLRFTTHYVAQQIEQQYATALAKSGNLPCRHAIAYRRHIKVPGPLIPWGGIDERIFQMDHCFSTVEEGQAILL
ncbi:hypothetical protein F444_03977 [Phytophthora nicotianae P1976]|uniref:Uncharacterized protein n=1 Tax=Phytophthora nicotianae P1976 TaxID=1317066 RepID=A0A081ASC2_PHYNI|nr:hypothetical protein F444_03977 [Phytophthora nicotianae P1976]